MPATHTCNLRIVTFFVALLLVRCGTLQNHPKGTLWETASFILFPDDVYSCHFNTENIGLDCYCRPPPHTMCPTAFLAPTLTAKTCFICTQPQNAFFLAQLALQGNRANGKKSLPGKSSRPKKRNQNGSKFWVVSRRILLAQWPKKVPKIGPGPALAWTWSAEKG